MEEYRERAQRATEIERQSAERTKTGVFTGAYATNPVNGEPIPIWIADYVLMGYGTGAIMAVPAHDQRDFEFARKFDLPIVWSTSRRDDETPRGDDGGDCRTAASMVDSGPFDGAAEQQRDGPQGHRLAGGAGHRQGRGQLPPARLADLAPALLGRADPDHPLPGVRRGARAGGPAAGAAARRRELPADRHRRVAAGRHPGVRQHDLPASAAARRGARPTPWAASPARPGTSCASPTRTTTTRRSPARPSKYWLPVDLYVGGAEHAVMHLLYARFWTKVMYDAGLIDFDEPFQRCATRA